jgi:hypothetical protein
MAAMNAFWHGEQAAWRGVVVGTNPFQGVEAFWWMRGHEFAMEHGASSRHSK